MKNRFKRTYPISSIQNTRYFNPPKNKNNRLLKLELALVGEIDFNRINEVLQDVIKRHDSLRTVFAKNNYNKMMQAVYYELTSELTLVYAENNLDQKIASYLSGEPDFSLENGPLVKAALFLTEYNQGRLVVTFHHLIMDEWSLDLFLTDFLALYNQREVATSPQYKTYVDWLSKQDKEEGEAFYQRYLANYQGGLPTKPFSQEHVKASSKSYELFVANYPTLFKAIHQQKITFNTLIQTVWGLVLNKIYDNCDLVIGCGTFGRNAPVKGLEKIIGAFSNVLPLRIKYTPELTFLELLTAQQAHYKEGLKYEQVSLTDIFAQHPLSEDLFTTVITVAKDNFATKTKVNQKNLQVEKIPSQQPLDYPLSLTVYPSQKIELLFKWDESSYKASEIQSFFEGIESILAQVEIDLKQPLKDLQVLSHEQFIELTETFNFSNYTPINQPSLNVLTSEFLSQGGNHIALIQAEKQISYRELLTVARGLGNFIVAGGGKPNDLIVIYGQSSIELYQLVYGVILSGCAFLVIDKNLATEEIEARLVEAKAKMIIGTEKLPRELGNKFKVTLFQAIDLADKLLKPVLSEATDTACVVYSSVPGEKGNGVLLTSQGVINLADYTANYMQLVQPKMLALSSVSDEMFIFELLIVLFSQGTLVLTTEEKRGDYSLVSQQIKQEKINFINIQANHLQEMLQASKEDLASLTWIVLSEKKISQDLVELLAWEEAPRVFHGYGKTEGTIYNTFSEVTSDYQKNGAKPSCLTQIYLLNQELNPVPVDRIGEVYLAGSPLAKDYLAQEDLSNKKLIPHPWLKDEKLFKTGDLGRWNQAGQLEYLGRKKDQFKMRGQRINLKEIAAVISTLPEIKAAKVYVIDEPNELAQVVCVYCGQELTPGLIKENLGQTLSELVLPQFYLHVEEFVLNSQGEFDERYYTKVILTRTKKVPAELEKAELTENWVDFFKSRQLRAYFEIKTTYEQLVRLSKLLKNKLAIEGKGLCLSLELAEPKTMVALKKALAQYEKVSSKREANQKEVNKTIEQEKLEILADTVDEGATEGGGRLLPLAQVFAQQNLQFNQVVILTNKTWSLENYQRLLIKLIEKHPLLLSQIVKNQQGEFFYQFSEATLSRETIIHYRLSQGEFLRELNKIRQRCQKEINPSAGKMFQWAVIQTQTQDYLIFAASRFIVDQVSWQILLNDLQATKLMIDNNQNPNSSQETNSIISYANYCQDLVELGYFAGEVDYWNSQWIPNQLEEKYQIPGNFKSSFTYEKNKTAQLLNKTTELKALILSAYSSVLANRNSWAEMSIFLINQGRNAPDDYLDFSNTIGCFTSIYPLKIRGEDRLVKQFRQVAFDLSQVPHEGLGYTYLAQSKTNPKLKESYQTKFKNYFHYLGEITQNNQQVTDFKVTNLTFAQEMEQELDLNLATSCRAYIYQGELTVQLVASLQYLNHTEIDKMLIQIKLLLDKFITEELRVNQMLDAKER